jgi:hypothetical protein
MHKKGQQLSTTAIVLIVLGVLVLVLLILGFTVGWKKIFPWIKPGNNIKDIANACKLACGSEAKFSYCSEKRELNDGEIVLKDVNCHFLSEVKPVYGIDKCPKISCDNVVKENVEAATLYCDEEITKIKALTIFQADKDQKIDDLCSNQKVQYLNSIGSLEEKTCENLMNNADTAGITISNAC